MSKRTPQYEDFISLVYVPDFLEEEKFVKKYWRTVHILKTVTVFALLLVIISIMFNSEFKGIIEVAAVVGVMIYILYRNKSSKKFRDILLEKCDPDRALARYASLISYTKRQSNWEMHFYNLGSILYYAGRIDDVEKIQSLLKKYCPTSLGNMYYEMIGATLALYAMDRGKLQNHCSNMAELIKSVRLNRTMQGVYYEKMQYPTLVQMWDRGEYAELYHTILYAKFLKNTMSAKVKQNYYLYEVAAALNDKEKMDKHRAFVIQNGKGLWYYQALMPRNELFRKER